jgi:hypothetical protein
VTAEPQEVQVIVQLSEELGSGAKLVAVPLPELTISQAAPRTRAKSIVWKPSLPSLS